MAGVAGVARGNPRRRLLAAASLTSIAIMALWCFAALASGAVVTEYLYDFGPDGTENSNFERIVSVAVDQQTGVVYVLDGETGTLFKFEADGSPLDWGGTAGYISGNEISGIAPAENNGAQLAVDSTSHILYVTEPQSVRAFEQNGDPASFTEGPGDGTSEISGFTDLDGVAVDSNGSIYASDSTGAIFIYASTGEPLTSFATSPPSFGFSSGSVGVGPDGTVSVVYSAPSPEGGGVYRYVPEEFPVTPTTTYTPADTIPPSSGSLPNGIGVDPLSGDIYLIEDAASSSWIGKYDSNGNLLEYIGKPGEEGAATGLRQGVAIVGGGDEIQFYTGTNENGGTSRVSIFGEKVEVGPPEIISTSIEDVTATSATLSATINPNTAETTYRFEYGLGDCSVTICTSLPVGGGRILAGHRPVVVSQDLSGLEPGRTYHFRVVAENLLGPPTKTAGRTFTTQVIDIGFQLPDGRVWEMVSPPNKQGARLTVRPGPVQASLDGDGLVYESFPSIASDPAGSREGAWNLARRQVDGSWGSHDLSPPYDEASPVSVGAGGEYKLFSSDLRKGVLEPGSDMPLSPSASEGTPYLRQNSVPPVYTPLVSGKEPYSNVPAGTEFGGTVDVVGVAPDFEHFALRSVAPLVVAPELADATLYTWAAGQIEAASILPVDEGGIGVAGLLGSGPGSVQGALSQDGSRVFWSTGSYGTANDLTALYVRDMEADESARLDVARGGSGTGTARPAFQGANPDGTVVFFTDTRALTADSSPSGADLYRCELSLEGVASGCLTLTNISAPSKDPGESADVQGVATAISHDAKTVYFVARGVLEEDPNKLGETAEPGQPNLYLWQDGNLRYIATLSDEDSPTWGGNQSSTFVGAVQLSAAASPNGEYLAFSSFRSLTGYDNREALSGEPAQEIFRYDATADRLDCVSCNPSGAAARGRSPRTGALVDPLEVWSQQLPAALLPEAFPLYLTGPTLYRPRSVFDSGRVFFNAYDSLVPADSNGNWDVYQHEPIGVGDCNASSGGASISRSADGCVALISSGTSENEAAFLDASGTGDDAFFITSAKLSVFDEDEEPDVYDARVGGIAAVRKPVSECLGEACQPPALPPSDPIPGSASFHGAGNQPARCGALAARAATLTRRARRARQAVARSDRPGEVQRGRRKARRLARHAKALEKRAKRCKRLGRRAAR